MLRRTQVRDRQFLTRRIKAETKAALSAKHPTACAAHVQLATEYLRELNAADGRKATST